MAKQSVSFLPSTRVDPVIRAAFLNAAQFNDQTPSEAMRHAALTYIRCARDKRLREQAERIRANVEEEAEVMAFLAAHTVAFGND